MKNLLASFGWVLLLLPLISVAGTKTMLNALESPVNSDVRKVSNFTGISSSGSYEVFVKLGSTENLRIEGDAEDIENVETVVDNGLLKIRSKKRLSGWNLNSSTVRIYITAKSLKDLTVSGSGKITINETLKTDRLNTSLSGSGSINLNVQTTTLNANVSGSGNIKVSGSVQKVRISISGSGQFKGRDLKASTADIKVSGSGQASVFVNKTLNASLSGSGRIYYSGNAVVRQTKSGSGSIIKD